jgi:hypothetical protein
MVRRKNSTSPAKDHTVRRAGSPGLSRIYSVEEMARFVADQFESCDLVLACLRGGNSTLNSSAIDVLPSLCFRIEKSAGQEAIIRYLRVWGELDFLGAVRDSNPSTPTVANLERRFVDRETIFIHSHERIAVALLAGTSAERERVKRAMRRSRFASALRIYLHQSAVYAGMSLERSRTELVKVINSCFSFSVPKTCAELAKHLASQNPIRCLCLSTQSGRWQLDSAHGVKAEAEIDVIKWIGDPSSSNNRSLLRNGKPVITIVGTEHILAIPFASSWELQGKTPVHSGHSVLSVASSLLTGVLTRSRERSLHRQYVLVVLSQSNWPDYFLRNVASQIEFYFAHYRPERWREATDALARVRAFEVNSASPSKNESWLAHLLRRHSGSLELLRNGLDAVSVTIRLEQNGQLEKIVDVSDEGVKFEGFEHSHIPISSKRSVNAFTFNLEQGWNAVYVADVAEIANHAYLKVRPETESELCIPLEMRGFRYGVMNIEARSTHPFDADTIDRVVQFSVELSNSVMLCLVTSDHANFEAGWHAIQSMHETKSIATKSLHESVEGISNLILANYENFAGSIAARKNVSGTEFLSSLDRWRHDFTSNRQLRIAIRASSHWSRQLDGRDVQLFFLILTNLTNNMRAYGADEDWITVFTGKDISDPMLRVRAKISNPLPSDVVRHSFMAPIFRDSEDSSFNTTAQARLPKLGLFIVGALARKLGGYAHFGLLRVRPGSQSIRTIEIGLYLRAYQHDKSAQ